MVMPYLSFNGTCEAAFRWYESVFGGTIRHMSKYGDIPDNPMSEEQKAKVMHAQMMLTKDGGISGADVFEAVKPGHDVSIQVHLEQEAKAREIFPKLAEGGTVIAGLEVNPQPDDSSISGCVRDKFGFTWIISAMRD